MDFGNASSNLTTPEWDEWDYSWPYIVSNIMQGTGTVIGILANALLLFLFAVTPSLRTPSNIILLQRGIADLCSLLPFPFVVYYRAVGFSKISVYLCRTLSLLLHIGTVSSTILLMSYTLYNYQASNPKQFPRQYRIQTVRITSIIAWILAIAVGLAAFFLTYAGDFCDYAPLFNHLSLGHILAQMSVLLIIPLVVVWVFVSMTSPILPAEGEGESLGGGENLEFGNPRLLLGLAILFTVVYGTYWLFMVIQIFSPFYLMSVILSVIVSMGIFTEILNPILVMLLSEEVRREVFAWLIPSRHRSNTIPMH